MALITMIMLMCNQSVYRMSNDLCTKQVQECLDTQVSIYDVDTYEAFDYCFCNVGVEEVCEPKWTKK